MCEVTHAGAPVLASRDLKTELGLSRAHGGGKALSLALRPREAGGTSCEVEGIPDELAKGAKGALMDQAELKNASDFDFDKFGAGHEAVIVAESASKQ